MTVREILDELDRKGLNQAQLAKRLRVSQPTISRWRNGSEPKTVHRDKLLQLARDKGILPQGEFIARGGVPVVGYVGAGGTLDFSEGQGPFGEARVPPKGARRQTVAVRVRGNSMAPMLEDGWTVYYEDRKEQPTDDMFGKTCIVGLTDGPVLVKKLYRGNGAGRYVLASLQASEAPILDADVAWAARITFIEPK
jgi:phage repressor protein C with HTH and peptisase S24 domain